MRLISMHHSRNVRISLKPAGLTLFAAALLLALPSTRLHAQAAVPAGQGDSFRDTSSLKLPADATKGVAIEEFEDLECPACSHAFPIVHQAIEKYHIPYIRHDFPLPMHIWSRDAAITARYLQDKVSADAAYQYRRDVFANQLSIASKDDLSGFTNRWFAQHKISMPFMLGPNSLPAAEVEADYTLGQRIGLMHTPTIFVLTQHGWIQVVDITQLYSTIDQALAEARPVAKPVTHTAVRKPAAKN